MNADEMLEISFRYPIYLQNRDARMPRARPNRRKATIGTSLCGVSRASQQKRSSDDAKLSELLIGDGRTTARQRSHLSSCRSSSLKSLRSLNWRYTEAKRT